VFVLCLCLSFSRYDLLCLICRLVGYPGHYRRLFGLRQEEVSLKSLKLTCSICNLMTTSRILQNFVALGSSLWLLFLSGITKKKTKEILVTVVSVHGHNTKLWTQWSASPRPWLQGYHNHILTCDWLFFQCAPSGCLMELAQQLVIIMVGKQTINNVQEIVIPWVVKELKTPSPLFWPCLSLSVASGSLWNTYHLQWANVLRNSNPTPLYRRVRRSLKNLHFVIWQLAETQ